MELGGPASFDMVMSDMAPWTTGTRFVDQCRSFDLYIHALTIAEGTLRGDGAFIGKIFQGPDFRRGQEARREPVRQDARDEARCLAQGELRGLRGGHGLSTLSDTLAQAFRACSTSERP